MMNSLEKYNELFDFEKKVLKEIGFKNKGTSFFIIEFGNWGMIQFQKSQSNTMDDVRFTLNLGVCYGVHLKFVRPNVKTPAFLDCQLRQRIGPLLPGKQDYWWEINQSTSMEWLKNAVKDALTDIAIPYLYKFTPDEKVIEYWLAGEPMPFIGWTKYEYLILLLRSGNDTLLSKVIEDFKKSSRNKDQDEYINDVLKELGV